ncbi:head closure Hc2 [Sinorhizobium phage phiM9]|uniref:Neck protein n=1 Tax=Sinorhizobium phage phiM9 TaxID=1636182 RepID=A0A0F6R5Y1_9CAUD|nr:head closure Hc2 [Sinorhizobium phage phiM9]AKE44755.1 neck protein [Sinorhizobium phage phiM9]
MANPYFNNFIEDQDASLIYDLSDELIYNAGIEVEYLPREVVRMDPILNEPLSSQFNKVFQLDALVESSDAFFAGNEMFGAAGLAFSFSSASISVSRRKFMAITGMDMPRDGDLVFIKPNQMLFEITNTNTRDPLISGGRQFTYVIYLQPFKYGEGTSSFDTKFQSSESLSSVLDEFLSRVDQTKWTGYDSSSVDTTSDTMTVDASHDHIGIQSIIRADTDEFTADCELTADDQLKSWNESAEDVLEMMDERIPEYADNDKFECAGDKIIIDETNPFGFV